MTHFGSKYLACTKYFDMNYIRSALSQSRGTDRSLATGKTVPAPHDRHLIDTRQDLASENVTEPVVQPLQRSRVSLGWLAVRTQGPTLPRWWFLRTASIFEANFRMGYLNIRIMHDRFFLKKKRSSKRFPATSQPSCRLMASKSLPCRSPNQHLPGQTFQPSWVASRAQVDADTASHACDASL